MLFVENLKTIFETITALSTATIVIITLVKHIPKKIKHFFVKSIPLFFKGTTGENGKKIRFFRAVKLEKENQNKIKRMISIIAPNYKTDEYFVLNKEELSKMIEKSKLFTHISYRKN